MSGIFADAASLVLVSTSHLVKCLASVTGCRWLVALAYYKVCLAVLLACS